MKTQKLEFAQGRVFNSDLSKTGTILLYDRALSDDERKKIEKYLSKKWKISLWDWWGLKFW